MRIPIDYDDRLLMRELVMEGLDLLQRQEADAVEIWRTSTGHYTIILDADMDLDHAIEVIQNCNCDEFYKQWVAKRRILTERTSSKGGIYPVRICRLTN